MSKDTGSVSLSGRVRKALVLWPTALLCICHNETTVKPRGRVRWSQALKKRDQNIEMWWLKNNNNKTFTPCWSDSGPPEQTSAQCQCYFWNTARQTSALAFALHIQQNKTRAVFGLTKVLLAEGDAPFPLSKASQYFAAQPSCWEKKNEACAKRTPGGGKT